MTAALLGALHGHEWLGDLRNEVQDRLYIRDLADQCAQSAVGAPIEPTRPERTRAVTDPMLKAFQSVLADDVEALSRFVDSRQCRLLDSRRLESTGNTSVTRYVLDVKGQTIRIDEVTRLKDVTRHNSDLKDRRSAATVSHVTILVPNPGVVERFYRLVLGLPVEGTMDGDIVVGAKVVFRPDYHSRLMGNVPRGLLVTFVVSDLDAIETRLVKGGFKFHAAERNDSRSIRVTDPAGNDVDLRQPVDPSGEEAATRQRRDDP
jgi:catechol 2,3-dioxygenase-like lactoylglutathione lyase family enzyme